MPERPSRLPFGIQRGQYSAASRFSRSLTNPGIGHLALGGSAGLLALSKGVQAVQSLRHGELGNAALYGALAYGAGSVAYHSFMRTPQYTKTVNMGTALLNQRFTKSQATIQKIAKFMR